MMPNRKVLAFTMLLLAPIAAQAQTIREAQAVVVEVYPLYEKVVVGQQCYPQTTYIPVQRSYVAAGIGGVAGGLLGHTVGGGAGQTIATAAGAVVGALTGDYLDSRQQHYQAVPINTCSNVVEPRITGTRYIAEYEGTRFMGELHRQVQIGELMPVQVTTRIVPLR